MRIQLLAILVLAAGAAACARPGNGTDRAPARPHYLADFPFIPQSIITDTTGSPEVEHRGLMMQLPMDSVTAFYRRELPARGWHIVGDMSDTSRVSLYLQRDSLNLWVQIHRLGPLATEYAVTATGQNAAPAAAAPRP